MKRWQVVFLIIGAVLFCAGLGVIRYFIPYDLDSELTAARAQGIPTSFSEMKRPPVSPSEDAAADYERARAIRRRSDFSEHEMSLLETLAERKPITNAETAELRRAFNSHAEYIDAINEAASKPHLAHVAKDGSALDPEPVFPTSRGATKTLHDEATLLMQERRPVEAARKLALGYNVVQHVYEQPTLNALVTATPLESVVDSGLKDLLLWSPPNVDLARAVRDAAGRDLNVPDVHQALLGEVANEVENTPSPNSKEWSEIPFRERALGRARFAADIHLLVRVIRASQQPEPLRRRSIQRAVEELKRKRSRSPALDEGITFVGVVPGVEVSCLESAARRRVLYAGACVLEFRARTGHYPASLEEAVKSVPVDPIDMKPLAYRRTATGFEVEAVAAQAERAAAASVTRASDMVFAYPKP